MVGQGVSDMRNPVEHTKDLKLEFVVSRLLQVGVLVSAAIVAIGAFVYLLKYGGQPAQYHFFRGEPDELKSVTEIVKGALHLRGKALIQMGLLLLIATPVARVAFSVAAFAEQRDRLYVVVTSIVLLLLIYSLLYSH